MLDLAAGTRYFDSLDETRVAVRGIDLRSLLGEPAWSHATLAMTRISESSSLLKELGSVCESSTERAPSDDVRGTLNAIADVCFIAQTELNALEAQLRRCEARPQVAVVVAESVYRKLRRIASRTQWLLAPLVGRSADVSEQELDIVEGSIIVRRLYSAFRKALSPVDGDATILPAMRSGAQALTALLSDPRSSELRVQDYQALVALQDRVKTWIRSSAPLHEARNILSDLFAFAELTRMVNRRQELRSHDAVMLDCVLRDAFPTMLGDEIAKENLLYALDAIEGLDDMMDALAARLRVDPTESTYLDLRLRAAELHR